MTTALLSKNEAAERLGLHPSTVKLAFHEGRLKGRKFGGTIRIPEDVVKEVLLREQYFKSQCLSVAEAASLAGVCSRTIRNWCGRHFECDKNFSGKLRVDKLSFHVFIKKES